MSSYCPDCGHRAADHAAAMAGCLMDCPCRVPSAGCVDPLSYRHSQTGDHDPSLCASYRDAGRDGGWHAGWGRCAALSPKCLPVCGCGGERAARACVTDRWGCSACVNGAAGAVGPVDTWAECEWSDAGECAMARERSVSGRSDAIPACPIHGAHPDMIGGAA